MGLLGSHAYSFEILEERESENVSGCNGLVITVFVYKERKWT